MLQFRLAQQVSRSSQSASLNIHWSSRLLSTHAHARKEHKSTSVKKSSTAATTATVVNAVKSNPVSHSTNGINGINGSHSSPQSTPSPNKSPASTAASPLTPPSLPSSSIRAYPLLTTAVDYARLLQTRINQSRAREFNDSDLYFTPEIHQVYDVTTEDVKILVPDSEVAFSYEDATTCSASSRAKSTSDAAAATVSMVCNENRAGLPPSVGVDPVTVKKLNHTSESGDEQVILGPENVYLGSATIANKEGLSTDVNSAVTLVSAVSNSDSHSQGDQAYSDVHRNLLKGGIFMYPGTTDKPKGKLR